MIRNKKQLFDFHFIIFLFLYAKKLENKSKVCYCGLVSIVKECKEMNLIMSEIRKLFYFTRVLY